MRLMFFSSALPFSLLIMSSGFTLSKFRSKMIRLGRAWALASTSSSFLTNSTVMPARLAASLILTEKNRSLTTASTFLLPCFCIQFGYNYSLLRKLQTGLAYVFRLRTGGKVHLTEFEKATQARTRLG